MTECNKRTLTDSKYKGKQRRTWWCDSRKGFAEEVRHELGLEEMNMFPYDSTTKCFLSVFHCCQQCMGEPISQMWVFAHFQVIKMISQYRCFVLFNFVVGPFLLIMLLNFFLFVYLSHEKLFKFPFIGRELSSNLYHPVAVTPFSLQGAVILPFL